MVSLGALFIGRIIALILHTRHPIMHGSHSTHSPPNNGSHSTHSPPNNGSHSTHSPPNNGSHSTHSPPNNSSHSTHSPPNNGSHSTHSPPNNGSHSTHSPPNNGSHSTHSPPNNGSHSTHSPPNNGSHSTHSPPNNGSHSTHSPPNNGSHSTHSPPNNGSHSTHSPPNNGSHSTHSPPNNVYLVRPSPTVPDSLPTILTKVTSVCEISHNTIPQTSNNCRSISCASFGANTKLFENINGFRECEYNFLVANKLSYYLILSYIYDIFLRHLSAEHDTEHNGNTYTKYGHNNVCSLIRVVVPYPRPSCCSQPINRTYMNPTNINGRFQQSNISFNNANSHESHVGLLISNVYCIDHNSNTIDSTWPAQLTTERITAYVLYSRFMQYSL